MRLSNLKPDSRISASKVPNTRPPTAESAVSVRVKVMPSTNRYPSDRRMTSKSKLLNIGCPLLPGNVAGDGHLAFEKTHADHDDDIDEEIQHRCGREGLEHLKRKLLHGARLAGQLDQADGDGDRGVLDRAEKLGRQRRQDDAERGREQHIAVRLARSPVPARSRPFFA